MKKCVKLYNVMFPIWFFYLYPTWLWLIVLPLNAVIDSAVLFLAARHEQIPDKWEIWRKCILKVWIFGFLADFTGAVLILGIYIPLANYWALHLFPGVTLNSLPGVILAGVVIYVLNRRFTFTRTALSSEQVHKLSLALAIFTAPYLMLIPLYG